MRVFVTILVMLFSLSTPSFSASEDDIKQVIRSQIEAFQNDDLEGAFGYAHQNIQQIFKTAENFGRMVERGYPMIYRPKSYAFEELREVAGGLYQNLIIIDASGRSYIAEYHMEETGEGWRIRGVQLFKTQAIGA